MSRQIETMATPDGGDITPGSGYESLGNELSAALTSQEEFAPSFDKTQDPVINMDEANQAEDDGTQGESAQASDEAQAAAAKAAEEWFEFTANGAKKKFNLADKEAIKKILPLAEGARRWQSERDSWKSKYSEVETSHKDLKSNWDKLETAFKSHGIDGVIDMLGGKPGYSKDYWEDKYQQRMAYEKAPDHEKARIDYEKRIQELERVAQAQQEAAEARERKLQEIREKEDETQLIADLRPHYNSFRFDGKLGDKEAEEEYNQMLWDKSIEALTKLSSEGQPLTQSVIKAQFKATHDKYAKVLRINKEEAEKKVVDNLKTEAKKNLASSVRSGATPGSTGAVNTGSSSQSLSSAMARMLGIK